MDALRGTRLKGAAASGSAGPDPAMTSIEAT
jgi:hypothetical protein